MLKQVNALEKKLDLVEKDNEVLRGQIKLLNQNKFREDEERGAIKYKDEKSDFEQIVIYGDVAEKGEKGISDGSVEIVINYDKNDEYAKQIRDWAYDRTIPFYTLADKIKMDLSKNVLMNADIGFTRATNARPEKKIFIIDEERTRTYKTNKELYQYLIE